MVATSPWLRLFLAVQLVSLTAAATVPAGLMRRANEQGQLVFGSGDAAVFNEGIREPDFVESMLLEAQREGIDVQQWGIDEANRLAKVVENVKETVEDGIEKAKETIGGGSVEEEEMLMFIEPAIEQGSEMVQEVQEQINHHRRPSWLTIPKAKDQMQPGSGWVWNVCGSHQEAVVLKEINVTPDPPVAGQNLTVYARGTVNNDIEAGTYADVVVKLGFIRLLAKRFDVCELADENDAELRCPVKAGEYEMTHTVELPKEIPPARFNVHVNGKTQDDVDLMCMDLSIDFSHR